MSLSSLLRIVIFLHITHRSSMLPPSLTACIEPFLPPQNPSSSSGRPYVTLTYAQLLDSRIAAAPGVQTKISGPETKAMTHYIRSKHDAILVGIGTVLADDPKLNCRHEGGSSPRPVVIDPGCKWDYKQSQLCRLVNANKTNGAPSGAGDAKAPFIVVNSSAKVPEDKKSAVECDGGKYIRLPLTDGRHHNWGLILQLLEAEHIGSVMVEGGAQIINDLLVGDFVDALIVTIGPVFLGKRGVEVAPASGIVVKEPSWWYGSDTVMCGRIRE